MGELKKSFRTLGWPKIVTLDGATLPMNGLEPMGKFCLALANPQNAIRSTVLGGGGELAANWENCSIRDAARSTCSFGTI